jgi:acetyl-CoA acetyltransferase
MANRRVAIVGASTSDCGRVDDKTAFELNFQGTTRALAEAGIDRSEVDGFMALTGALPPIELAEYLGLRPDWVDSTGHGGSIWECMVEHAAAALAQGLVEVVVLTYGSTQRADLKKKLRMANLSFGTRGPIQFAAPFGHPVGSHYAMVARRHMHEFGTTLEQLAEVAVSARHNAGLNPDAYYRDPITIDDVLNAPMVWDPLSKLHCCIRTDGGGAIVMTHEERARDCATTPVWVLGTGEAASHTTMSEWEDFTESPCVRSGRLAFERAGVTPEDIDTAQIYDAFTPMVVLTLEGLGFCPKGEGGAFVEDGKLRVGGALPTNTDGGGLSACQPGMRGIFLLIEAVRQLRGEAGARQVPDARLACVNGTSGWFTASGTVILGTEPG